MTERFEQAPVHAPQIHRDQVRKSNSIPYISQLLMVTGFVIEHGGHEDTAIAAVLHDAVEDAGGTSTRAEIEARFGAPGALLVACADNLHILVDHGVSREAVWSNFSVGRSEQAWFHHEFLRPASARPDAALGLLAELRRVDEALHGPAIPHVE